MDYMKAIKILKARKLTVLSVAVLAFCLVAVAPQPDIEIIPIYTSKAKVLITPPSKSVRAYGGQAASAAADFSWFADPTVLTELLRSEELLGRVIQSTNAQISQQELAYSVNVEPLSGQRYGAVRLFALSVKNKDPKEAQKLTRLLTDEFVRYVEDLSAREFASTRRFIEELVLEAEGRRDAAEGLLMEVRERYMTGQSEESMMMQARSLEARINEIERSISASQVEVNSLRDYMNGSTSSPPWQVLSGGNGSLTKLESNVADKKLELARLQDIYTDSNEKVVAATRQLTKAEVLYDQALTETVDSLYRTKSGELQQHIGKRGSLGSELNSLLSSRMSDDDRRLVKKYERELQVWEQNHLNLQQQLYQARVVEQSSRRQGSVNVLEQPGIGVVAFDPEAKAPMGNRALKRNLLSIPFCLILGLAAAFTQEYLSSSTKLRPRIEEALEIPVLAVIPSAPSELTVDWETFKRPNKERLQPLVLASHRGAGFEARRSKVGVPASSVSEAPREEQRESNSGGFGDNFRFRNQK